ncbi:MAG: hypothetical protein ACYDCC_09980 [Actinomycetota bacterium]
MRINGSNRTIGAAIAFVVLIGVVFAVTRNVHSTPAQRKARCEAIFVRWGPDDVPVFCKNP